MAITPNEPLTTDDLEVVVQGNAADKQGDAVTYGYAWFVDDTPPRPPHFGPGPC